MKISCILVTQSNRMNLLPKCLLSYSRQTIENRFRELLIIHHDTDEFTFAVESILKKYNIKGRILKVPIFPLGELRNIALRNATGDLLCQWDDDDFYHPNRLEIQSNLFNLGQYTATLLGTQLYLFYQTRELFVRRGGREGIHGTIMFKNGQGYKYDPSLSKGEDTRLINDILDQNASSVYNIDDHPELFVRTYHGANTWSFEHHYQRLNKQAFPVKWLKENEKAIRKWLEVLEIKGVKVRDTQAVAFEVD